MLYDSLDFFSLKLSFVSLLSMLTKDLQISFQERILEAFSNLEILEAALYLRKPEEQEFRNSIFKVRNANSIQEISFLYG